MASRKTWAEMDKSAIPFSLQPAVMAPPRTGVNLGGAAESKRARLLRVELTGHTVEDAADIAADECQGNNRNNAD